jgi:DNA polymerase I-like protein with 3'-5' exonuclease and polymerase domains
VSASAHTNGSFPTSEAEAARYYLSRGLSPVPLTGRTKAVTFTGWQEYRADPENLATFDGRNIGLLCGRPSNNTYDVDLDAPEAMAAADVLLPATALVYGRKSAPRSHRWYCCDDEPSFLKFKDPFRPDDAKNTLVELRNTSKQTMCPPSIHPDSGERVEWHELGDPLRIEAVELERAVKRVAAAALVARYWPGEGGRQDVCLALAGGLLRLWGNDAERVGQFVTAVLAAAGVKEDPRDYRKRLDAVRDTAKKLAKGDDPKVTGFPRLKELLGDKAAVADKVTEWCGVTLVFDGQPTGKSGMSGRTTGAAAYVPVPEYVTFPTDVMPGKWGEFCREGARVLKCDPGYIAIPAIAVMAGAVGMTRTVFLGGEWYEPAVFWCCVVGVSGTLKSPAAELSTAFLAGIEKKHAAEHKEAMREYKTKLAEYKRGDEGEEPAKPTRKRVMVGDITLEKLAGLFDDNRRGLVKFADELTCHLGSFTRYKGKAGGSDEHHYLSMHRAMALQYDRKSGDKTEVYVPNAALSVVGGIQPGVLRRLMSRGLFESGSAARFVWTMPPRVKKEYVEEGIGGELKKEVKESLERLYALQPDTDEHNEPAPKAVPLSAAAKGRWKRFVNEWGERQYLTDGDLAAALSKLEGMAARFALLHHLVEHKGGGEVSLASVEAGIRFVNWMVNETERVYRVLNESDDAYEVRELVDLVKRLALKSPDKDRLTGRDLQRSRGTGLYPTVEHAEAALDSLVGYGVGRWEPGTGKPGRGGKVSRVFVLTSLGTPPDIPDIPDKEGEGDGGVQKPSPDEPDGEPPTGGAAATSINDVTTADTQTSDGQPEPQPTGMSGMSGMSDTPQTGIPPEGVTPRGFKWASELSGPGYEVVTTHAGMGDVWEAIRDSERVGLDLETTGLDPRTDRVRLMSLHTEKGTYLIDCFRVEPTPLFDALAETEIVGHNLLFDLQFLARLGFTPGKVYDTFLASKVADAGRRALGHSLAEAAERHLKEAVDKAEQKSDWSGPLTPAQLSYAARDAELPVRLRPVVDGAGHGDVIDLENRCLPAVAWMASKGVAFDRTAWEAAAAAAKAEVTRLKAQMDDLAPGEVALFGANGRNWNSTDQVKAAFAAVGVELESTEDDTLAAVDHPLAAALREYRGAVKRVTAYGTNWLRHVSPDGRVYPGWRQLGADSGRMSCAAPNVQQLPRDVRYRRCFVAPPGRVLVKADYSQIELRLAATIAPDPAMHAAYQAGEDLHARTARVLTGNPEVTKADRQLAKAVNFGLLYGMGAKTLVVYARSTYGVTLTVAEATAYRNKFFQTYRGLKKWHAGVGASDRPAVTHTVLGRKRFEVKRFTEKLNTPVQGTGADGLKQALALLWERRAECPTAFPVLAVHDEIVVECDATDADRASTWLKTCMIDGMAPFAAPVPVEVEVSVGPNWGG